MSRLQKLQDEGKSPDLPPLPAAAEHLIEHLFDAGPCVHTGMGAVPMGHADLVAWQQNTGVIVTAWEARTLRRLSADYVAALTSSKDADEPAPYLSAHGAKDRRDVVAQQLRQALGQRTTKAH